MDDLEPLPLAEADPDEPGFLFGSARPIADYRELVSALPLLRDRAVLRRQAVSVGSAFRSRLVVADFARSRTGEWWFIEAGPGSCAGTAHEHVFKAVAARLRGEPSAFAGDRVGGPL